METIMTDELAPILSFRPLAALRSSARRVYPAAPVPTAIGGWLILPAIGLFGSVAMGLLTLLTRGSDVFRLLHVLGGGQEATVLLALLVQITLGIAVPIYLLVLMFGHRREFPARYIAWAVATPIFVIVDLFLTYAAFASRFSTVHAQLFNGDTTQALLSAAVGLCIWVPYMLNSTRVKNTFVN